MTTDMLKKSSNQEF